MRIHFNAMYLLAIAATIVLGAPLGAQERLSISDTKPANACDAGLPDGFENVRFSAADDPACESCDCQWSPGWTVTADALLLKRRDPSGPALMFDSDKAIQVLDASDLDFPVQGGVDLSLTRRLAGKHELELRYFGVDRWNTAAVIATNAGDLLQVNAALPVLTFAGTAVHASSSSTLHNVELNAQHRLGDWLTALGGFRYAELDEHMAIELAGAPIPFSYDTRTRNRLWGGQLGADLVLWDCGGPWTVEAVGKAGIFGNSAGHDSSYSTGVFAPVAGGRKTTTAFIGELGVAALCHLTEHVAIRGGYRLLWIDGVALATDQVAVSDFLAHTGIDGSGDVFYHGAVVGVECAW